AGSAGQFLRELRRIGPVIAVQHEMVAPGEPLVAQAGAGLPVIDFHPGHVRDLDRLADLAVALGVDLEWSQLELDDLLDRMTAAGFFGRGRHRRERDQGRTDGTDDESLHVRLHRMAFPQSSTARPRDAASIPRPGGFASERLAGLTAVDRMRRRTG